MASLFSDKSIHCRWEQTLTVVKALATTATTFQVQESDHEIGSQTSINRQSIKRNALRNKYRNAIPIAIPIQSTVSAENNYKSVPLMA